eukprot:TRINITY_DN32484_c0_g1_i1.p1 TRINITY_DN32484_c0_g1~~TRINITY_DN32484_c0_g1_i1.p1  ORF type:complete len:434 (-),score=76.61 TRINITY_DN32484_c0_g1_i1:131-1306(-)
MDECNGVYEASLEISNRQQVFENAHGFRLSLEVLPTKGQQDVRYGWVIGRDRVGFFGTKVEQDTDLPPSDSTGWRAFQAADGLSVPSSCLAKNIPADARQDAAWKSLMRGGEQGIQEAISTLSALLRCRAAAGEFQKRCSILTDLAAALMRKGDLQDSLAKINSALSFWPASSDAHLWKAAILVELGQYDDAAEVLQKLLTIRPLDGRAAVLLFSIESKIKTWRCIKDWLRYHPEIPLVKRLLTKESQANEKETKASGYNGNAGCPASPRTQLSKLARDASYTLEDFETEVHIHWTLPEVVRSRDLCITFQAEHLSVSACGMSIFEGDLAFKTLSSESSWTFAPPDLTVSLSKAMIDGLWPKWEVLYKEDRRTREARLGGLAFDPKKVQYW